ncbi:MAG: ABC transporter ATP-binding protein [Anaerolineaceae bacterium]|nr:MAG: ABC transporter ATP-binding protein [Anaerolineaceae bacterium]
MNSLQPAIVVTNLTKRFGDFTAVNGINFEVQRGEIFGFLGPNGSGKTTTIRMMLGLMKPSSGAVEVLGMKVDGDTQKIRPRVGYMSQRFSLYNDLTVFQNLNFYGAAYGLSNSELQIQIKEALAMAGLEGRGNAKTRELSGGWRQRLALSAAILHRPEVLFLDEPTAGVDPLSRRAFWDLLYQLISEGITVFVTTHYMDEAEHCHRLAFIQYGNVIAYGTSAEIKTDMMRGEVLELEPSDAPLAVKVLRAAQANRSLPIEEVELYGALVHIVASDVRKYQQAIAKELRKANIRTGHMSVIEPSLEDVFISAMKK